MEHILNVESLLSTLETGIREEIATRNLRDPAIIGIRTGGAWIADVFFRC